MNVPVCVFGLQFLILLVSFSPFLTPTASSVWRALVSLAACSRVQPLGLESFWLLWQVLASHLKRCADNTHLDSKTSPKSASCVADLKSIWQDASSHLQQALALQHLLPPNFSFCFLPTSAFWLPAFCFLSPPVSRYRSCGMIRFSSWRAQNIFCLTLFGLSQHFLVSVAAQLFCCCLWEEKGEGWGHCWAGGALA